MAKGVTIEIQGLKDLEKRFGKMPKHVVDSVDVIMERGASSFENKAADSAQAQKIFDTGRLLGDISYEKKKKLDYEVVSAAPYSAYHEYGTITHVSVPSSQAAFASQFKGRGIKKTGGIRARPFFFIHMLPVQQEMTADVEQMFKQL